MSRIHGTNKHREGKIPDKATEIRIKHRPSICFHHMMDTVAKLEDLSKEWIVMMLKQFKVFGGMTWEEVYRYKGLGWDSVPQHSMKYPIPKSLGLDSLNHIKVSGKSRVWGFREGDAFQLVWYDPEHKVTPE